MRVKGSIIYHSKIRHFGILFWAKSTWKPASIGSGFLLTPLNCLRSSKSNSVVISPLPRSCITQERLTYHRRGDQKSILHLNRTWSKHSTVRNFYFSIYLTLLSFLYKLILLLLIRNNSVVDIMEISCFFSLVCFSILRERHSLDLEPCSFILESYFAPYTSSVILGRLFVLSETSFPHMQNRDNITSKGYED